MPQNEKLDDFNPGVDRVWGSFSNSPEQTQSPASGLDAQAALAGKAIIGSGEHETRRVNQARGIVTYGEGEPTAIAFNDKSTESGNQYVLAPMEGLVISARGDVYTDVYRLPNVEFGKPWSLDNGMKTTAVKQLLSEYKIGDVAGDFHQDHRSPFIWAHEAIDRVLEQLAQQESDS